MDDFFWGSIWDIAKFALFFIVIKIFIKGSKRILPALKMLGQKPYK